jgi:GT2 family glycosyltransferase
LNPSRQPESQVAIVIVTWNGWDDTARCLESVERAAQKALIVLVDNGSTDGTPDRTQAEFPRVHVLRLNENRGFAAGTNVGVSYALSHGAGIVVLLNNDTVVEPRFLTPLVRVLTEDPAVGGACSLIRLLSSGDRKDPVWFAGARECVTTGIPEHVQRAPGVDCSPFPTESATGCCLAIRGDAWRATGPLDERFFAIFEDSDWSKRALRLGYKLMVVPESLVWHAVSQTFAREAPTSGAFYFVRNGLLYLERYSQRRIAHQTRFATTQIRPLTRAGMRRRIVEGASRLVGIVFYVVRRWGPAPRWLARLAAE